MRERDLVSCGYLVSPSSFGEEAVFPLIYGFDIFVKNWVIVCIGLYDSVLLATCLFLCQKLPLCGYGFVV